MITTTDKGNDYTGRVLVNPDPGASDAVDYMGRDVAPGDRDFMGRSLIDVSVSGSATLPAVLPFELGAS